MGLVEYEIARWWVMFGFIFGLVVGSILGGVVGIWYRERKHDELRDKKLYNHEEENDG